MAKKESKKEEPHKPVVIKAKKIAENLMIMVGKTKYVVPKVSDKDAKSVQNKILLYTKKPTEALLGQIMDIIDLATKKEEALKTEEKGIKKTIKRVTKNNSEIKAKKEKSKAILERAKKKDKKNLVIKNLVVTKHGGLAMKGVEIVEMPDVLINRIEDFLNKEQDITPLLNFWCLSLLNPNEVARMKAFEYITRNGFMLTPSGYIVTYRMVKKHDKQDRLLEEGIFTDAHTGTMRYVPGTVCRVPREECDEDGSKDCSKGLHTGTPEFIGIRAEKNVDVSEGSGGVGDGYGTGEKKTVVKEWQPGTGYGTGYGAADNGKYVDKEKVQKFNHTFGNQAIICLVNPQHIVSVPDSDTRKMRSCEFYFCKLTTAEEVIDMVEKDYLLFDHDYQTFELKDLKQLVSNNKDLKAYIDLKTDVGSRVANLESRLRKVKSELSIGGDAISTELDIASIKAIINQRIKILK